jgi:phosphoribosylaminoimidazolecarboxamide formyltransferase/IMP cyclohydrolase
MLAFVKGLSEMGIEIIASGGTAKALEDEKIKVKKLETITGFSNILGGRVKTLHPAVHAGILARRDNPQDMADLESLGMPPIDLVVCTLYPFERKVKRPDFPISDAVEWIDIGGPAMIRAAAKNLAHVAVVVDPRDYPRLLEHLKKENLEVSEEFRVILAQKAFALTCEYDARIQNFLFNKLPRQRQFARRKFYVLERKSHLRYGENPHQEAALYEDLLNPPVSFLTHQGKELSFNNIRDASAAFKIASFPYEGRRVACIVKHQTPCGIAWAENGLDAYVKAREADPQSAFGGVVGLNFTVDDSVAMELINTYLEVVLAPEYTPEALRLLAKKPNVRVLEVDRAAFPDRPGRGRPRVLPDSQTLTYETDFGYLLQENDRMVAQASDLILQSGENIPDGLVEDINFGLKIIRFLRSNAVLLVKDGVMIAFGAGQTDRVGAVSQCLRKAAEKARGAVLVSDAFFPFHDSIEFAAMAGVGIVVAPGGSKNDRKVIERAQELGVRFAHTPYRHFWH